MVGIEQIPTDDDREFQARFHGQVEDLGIEHVCLEPRSPRRNVEVEGSRRTDLADCHQLVDCTDASARGARSRSGGAVATGLVHTARTRETAYEVLRERLS